jgi:hypothetical protein
MSEHEQAEVEDKGGCTCGKALATGHPHSPQRYHEDFERAAARAGQPPAHPNGPPHKSAGNVVAKGADYNSGAPEPKVPTGRPLANPTGVGADSIAASVKSGEAATRLAQAIATGDLELARTVAAGLAPGHDGQIAEAVVQSLSGANVAPGFTSGVEISSQDAGASPAYSRSPAVAAYSAGRLQVQGNGRGTMGGHGWGDGRAR